LTGLGLAAYAKPVGRMVERQDKVVLVKA
jgi:hypothetical protein